MCWALSCAGPVLQAPRAGCGEAHSGAGWQPPVSRPGQAVQGPAHAPCWAPVFSTDSNRSLCLASSLVSHPGPARLAPQGRTLGPAGSRLTPRPALLAYPVPAMWAEQAPSSPNADCRAGLQLGSPGKMVSFCLGTEGECGHLPGDHIGLLLERVQGGESTGWGPPHAGCSRPSPGSPHCPRRAESQPGEGVCTAGLGSASPPASCRQRDVLPHCRLPGHPPERCKRSGVSAFYFQTYL